MPWWHKDLYYDLHANPHMRYYIKLDQNIIFRQKCERFIQDVFIDNRDELINDLIKNKDELKNLYNNGLKNELNYISTINEIKKWNKDYKTQGYKFLSREQIFTQVAKLI